MDIPVFSTKNFLEPTAKYVESWVESHPKEWFNADLINWAEYFKKPDDGMRVDLLESYYLWCNQYEVRITPDELIEKFGDYPKEDFSIMLKYIVNDKK